MSLQRLCIANQSYNVFEGQTLDDEETYYKAECNYTGMNIHKVYYDV